jgi:copper chaperone CopZ
MIVQVQIKNVYGNELIYPVNDVAVNFARIAGTKTLTREVIAHIKALGVKVEVVQAEVSL